MPLLTSDKVTDINTAINAAQDYINTLQAALVAAVNSGKAPEATIIDSRYEDAQLLENKLKGLLTVSEAESLQAAVNAIRNTTSVLQQQKEQIDKIVSDVGIAADVLGEIASIAAAVATLAACM